MTADLKLRIVDAAKSAMKAKDSARLESIRLIQAALSQKEIDERVELVDGDIVEILSKMLRKNRESIEHFAGAGRLDLVAKEEFQIGVITEFLPQQLGVNELEVLVKQAVQEAGAASIKDMGRVMNVLRTNLAGRADMSLVGGMLKQMLGG